MAGPIRISILANASQAKKEIQGVGKDAESGVTKAKKALLGLAGGFLAFKAVSKVTDVLKDSVAEAREAQKVGAQTAAVIKSTGGAANVTAKQVGDLSTSISNKVGIDDEAIQSGENMILTFKNIRNEAGKGNDVFSRTTSVVTDMSVAMKTDMKSSAILVGKALNDPVKGLTALTRVGVTFTDQQKKQIKAQVESGHTMAAQKTILKELNSEFGGSAAAQATAGERLKTTWKNVEEQIGDHLIPILDKVETYVAKNLPEWMAEGERGVGKLKAGFEDIKPQIEDVLNFLKANKSTVLDIALAVGVFAVAMNIGNKAVAASRAVMTAYKTVQAVFTTATEAQTVAQGELDAAMDANPIGLVVIAVAALAAGFVFAYKKSDTFRAIVDATFAAIKVVVTTVIPAIVNFIKQHWAPLLVILGGPIGLAAVLIVKNFDKIVGAIKVLGQWARWLWNNAFQPALQFIVKGLGFLLSVWAKMLGALGHVPGFGWAKDAANAMQDAANKANSLANNIRRIPATKRVDINVYTHHIGITGNDNPDLVGQGGSGRPSSRTILLTQPTTKPVTKAVTINVTAPVGSDEYTIGESLNKYLNAYLTAGSA